jgi:hypothetical protein
MAADEERIMVHLCNDIGKQASQVPIPVLVWFSSFEPAAPQLLHFSSCHFCSYSFVGLDGDAHGI